MKELTKTEVQSKIDHLFKKDSFTSQEVKKIRKLAMSHRILLGNYRKSFCKKCLSQLKGKIRISKGYKTVECASCGFMNKIKL